MAAQFKSTGIPLFKATGVPAMDVNCCCDGEGAPTCCGNGIPVSVTFSGATGCMSVMNGTFALTGIGSCLSSVTVSFPAPGDCLFGACHADTYYYHPATVNATVTQSNTDRSSGVTVQINLDKYNSSCIAGADEICYVQYDSTSCLIGPYTATELTPPFNGTYATSCVLNF